MKIKKKAAKGRSDSAPAARLAPFPIVGVGASAGGLEAFSEMLKALPRDTGMAFVLIQHLDPTHESMLASLLSRKSKIPVNQVTDGMEVEPNHVYVIPPNTTMGIHAGFLRLMERSPAGSKNMPIDHFFESLAAYAKDNAIGVILSGTASDGTFGLTAIKAEGGICFAQDEESAKFPGMPASAIAAGCVDFTLPPRRIAEELVGIAGHSRSSRMASGGSLRVAADDDGELRKLLILIRNAKGADLTHYKSSTIRRRIARRMLLKKVPNMREYVKVVQRERVELDALYQDVLIHVTSFFREPETYRTLAKQILPKLIEGRLERKTLRVWVPGCSTGEEAYSIAIVLAEYMGATRERVPVQIFATDLSEASIEHARAGLYSGPTLNEVSSERLAKFFVKSDGSQRVTQSIRDMCVFARQDLSQDPPFSRIDLISCRNVLIYFEPILQKKILAAFHYSLNANGILALGKSETLNAFPDLFNMAEKKGKFYRKKATTNHPQFTASKGYEQTEQTSKAAKPANSPADLQREADRLVWSRYAHSGVIVDESLTILHFRGETSPYLAPASGAASLHLLKMARGELLADLRTAFQKAKKENVSVRRGGIQLGAGVHSRQVALEVIPLASPDASERHFLILFDAVEPGHAVSGSPEAARAPGHEPAAVAKLRQELSATREYLEAVIEEQEATNEELKAASEEVLSNNEELQSTNEELETAQEELQSANEELMTLTEQQASRNAELNQLNDDLRNILDGVRIPILMLDSERRIRRFTPTAEKMFNLLPTDVGRPIENLRPNLDLSDLQPLISRTVDTLAPQEQEVTDLDGRYYTMSVRPYLTSENKVNGVLITGIDTDAMKRSLQDAQRARDYSNAIVETIREPLVVLDAELRVVTANRSFYDTFDLSPAEVEHRGIFDLAGGAWNIENLRKLLEEILGDSVYLNDFRVTNVFPEVGRRIMLLNARRLKWPGESESNILLAIEDITERQSALAALGESRERLRHLTAGLLTAQGRTAKNFPRTS
jgi:two-component system, chemotaxis family, CheB/CheR fusion protein